MKGVKGSWDTQRVTEDMGQHLAVDKNDMGDKGSMRITGMGTGRQGCGASEWGHKHGIAEERAMTTHFLQKVHIFLPGGLFEKVVRQELEQKS